MEVQHRPFSWRSSARDEMEVKGQELKCPICADLFTDPVMLLCGHNFCLSCIRTVWDTDESEEILRPLFCPECQIFLPSDLKLQINTDLQREVQRANISTKGCVSVLEEEQLTSSLTVMCDHCIEKSSVAVKSCLNCDASLCPAHTLNHQQKDPLKGHTLIDVTEDLLAYKCLEHGEELKLFCHEDQVVVCSLCVILGSHKNHKVVRLQEAYSTFQKELQQREAQLMQIKDLAETAMQKLGPMCSDFLCSARACRVRITEKYQQIKDLIEKDQQLMTDILETEEVYTNKWLESKRESLECHINDINALMSANKSLIQTKNHLKFFQHFKTHQYGTKLQLAPLSSAEWDNFTLQRMGTVLRLAESLCDSVIQNTQRLWADFRPIRLDAETAHPMLEVSSDMLEVCWRKKTTQHNTDVEGPCSEYSVLAGQSYSCGSHYWETAVWEKPYWLIGLSYELNTGSNEKNAKPFCSSSNKAFCYIYHGNGKYLVCNGPEEALLAVEEKIHKLGVWLDFQQGTVAYYNGDTLKLLYSFPVEFLGPVRPIFNPCVDLCKQNIQSLFLINLKGQREVMKK